MVAINIRAGLAVVRASAANAVADTRVIYTWRSWLFGWLGRMLSQVTFFTFLGHSLGAGGNTQFLVLGNSLMVCAIECLLVVASSAWERAAGTLGLLAAAPGEVGLVFFGRSLLWTVSGAGTSLVSLLVLGPLFGVRWSVAEIPAVVGLVLVTALTTYCFGLFLAALVIQARSIRNLVTNVTYLVMMSICGVEVPVGFWPPAVGDLAEVIPLTHSLAALRVVAAHGTASQALTETAFALLLGVGWFIVAIVAFRLTVRRGGVTGSIEFSS